GVGVAPGGVLHHCAGEVPGVVPGARPRRPRRRAVLGCRPRGDRAVLLHAARALARAASAVAVSAAVAAAMPRRAIGEAAGAFRTALCGAAEQRGNSLLPFLLPNSVAQGKTRRYETNYGFEKARTNSGLLEQGDTRRHGHGRTASSTPRRRRSTPIPSRSC